MNTQALIPVFAGTIQGRAVQLVDARELHQFLHVVTRFNDWIVRRIEEYGFIKNDDFLVTQKRVTNEGRGGNRKEISDYHLTLDMAKQLTMVERNDKGREARRYFIDCERRLLGQAALEAQQARLSAEQQVREKLLAFLADRPQGATLTEIGDDCFRRNRIRCLRQVLADLVAEGAASVCALPRRDGKPGRPRHLFKLASPALPSAQTPPALPPAGLRMLVTLGADGRYTSETLRPDDLVMTPNEFVEVLAMNGHAVVPLAAAEALRLASRCFN